LGVDRTTIWRWAKEGRIEIQRVGREVLIPRWEVELLRIKRRKGKARIKGAADNNH
jgi:excisionase family DNA binding protein